MSWTLKTSGVGRQPFVTERMNSGGSLGPDVKFNSQKAQCGGVRTYIGRTHVIFPDVIPAAPGTHLSRLARWACDR
jgi:hypothetical protein